MAVNSAAAATTLSALTAVEPGSVPLLFSLPNGDVVQLSAALNSTVEDIKVLLAEFTGSQQDVELAFGNSVLRGDSVLGQTDIVNAYGHASGLLRVIEDGTLNPAERLRALDSATAVVERVSNGINDMEVLCEAAREGGKETLRPSGQRNVDPDSASRTDGDVAGDIEQDVNATNRASIGDSIGSGEFNLFNKFCAMPTSSRTERADEGSSYVPNPAVIRGEHPVLADRGIVLGGIDGVPTPSMLARRLSEQLPDLFKPSAVDELARCVGNENQDVQIKEAPNASDGDVGDTSRSDKASPQLEKNSMPTQPSISAIRAARRKIRSERNESCDLPFPANQGPMPLDIGNSASSMEPEAGSEVRSSAAAMAACRSKSTMFAVHGKSTWLEDVFKTWEVDGLRNSGLLETVEGGPDLAEYLNSLDREAQADNERENIHLNNDDPGGSGSSEEDDVNAEDEEDDSDDQNAKEEQNEIDMDFVRGARDQNSYRSDFVPPITGRTEDERIAGGRSHARSSSDRSREPLPPREHGARGGTGPSVSLNECASGPAMPSHGPNLYTYPNAAHPAPIHPIGPQVDPKGSVVCYPPQGIARAAKIAPAPEKVEGGRMPGTARTGNHHNVLVQQIVPGLAGAMLPPPSLYATQQKRRGRKRKNPELTEEERALVRKLQNRESAKLSRVRRKVIAAEYEGQISELVASNEQLRDQVAALSNRLTYLQSILTVSVVPAGNGPGTSGTPETRQGARVQPNVYDGSANPGIQAGQLATDYPSFTAQHPSVRDQQGEQKYYRQPAASSQNQIFQRAPV